jgi:hypothetical protein
MSIEPLHQYLLYCFIIVEFTFRRSRDGLFNNFSLNFVHTIVYWPPCFLIVYGYLTKSVCFYFLQ